MWNWLDGFICSQILAVIAALKGSIHVINYRTNLLWRKVTVRTGRIMEQKNYI